MIASIGERLDLMESGIRGARPADKVGSVRRVTGLIIESEGPEVSIGQTCAITSSRHDERTEAEVVGFRDNMVLLMALESVHRIHPGCQVTAKPNSNEVPCGSALLGRVIDGIKRKMPSYAVALPSHFWGIRSLAVLSSCKVISANIFMFKGIIWAH